MILRHKCWWANRNHVTAVTTKTNQCIWHLLTCPDTTEDLSPGHLGAREPPAPTAAGEPPWTKRCHYLAEDRRKQRLIQSGTSLSLCIRYRNGIYSKFIKIPPHLQGKVDLILDVFDDVPFYSRVMDGIKHVPETKTTILSSMQHTARILMILKESRWLTGKDCTLLQGQIYLCSSGTSSGLGSSVDQEVNIFRVFGGIFVVTSKVVTHLSW